MQLSYCSYLLQFRHPFGVSSNTRLSTLSVFIQLQINNFIGYGEACLPFYLGENEKETIEFFEQAKPLLVPLTTSFDLNDVIQKIDHLSLKHNAAKAAIDMALHEVYGKIHSQTLSQIYHFKEAGPTLTSHTIGIDSEEKLVKKIEEANDFSILKIKAGTTNDKALIETIRRFTNKPLYVDVNQGWTDKHFVLEMLHWMKEQGVILVEQAMPVSQKADMQWVTERSPIPTIADESVKRLSDLKELNGAYSGINIKLMKCTGIVEALKMINYCKQNNIQIMLGCMAESSCATGAMAQLTGFADYVDLDAPLLYTNDPFASVSYKNGKILIPMVNGVGAEPITKLFD